MCDYTDRAQETEQFLRENDLACESERREKELPPVERCYNCDATVPPGVRFCGADCGNDYDKRRRAEAQRGR